MGTTWGPQGCGDQMGTMWRQHGMWGQWGCGDHVVGMTSKLAEGCKNVLSIITIFWGGGLVDWFSTYG